MLLAFLPLRSQLGFFKSFVHTIHDHPKIHSIPNPQVHLFPFKLLATSNRFISLIQFRYVWSSEQSRHKCGFHGRSYVPRSANICYEPPGDPTLNGSTPTILRTCGIRFHKTCNWRFAENVARICFKCSPKIVIFMHISLLLKHAFFHTVWIWQNQVALRFNWSKQTHFIWK